MNAAPDLLGWWSPDPRGVLPLDAMHVSRSLRRSSRRFEVTVDADFGAVITACADPARADGWIDAAFIDAYTRLHDLGWAHSVEVWAQDGEGTRELAGGLYGLAVGGLFAGESMFHRRTDASKVALLALVERLARGGGELLDVQWRTPHLASLGVVEVTRSRYLDLLAVALARPQLALDA
jgi:leucyl/phenylalanyl-tRNA--protein transferase